MHPNASLSAPVAALADERLPDIPRHPKPPKDGKEDRESVVSGVEPIS
jgi:hypothetical protein